MVDHLETSWNWSFIVFEKVVKNSNYFWEFESNRHESEGRLKVFTTLKRRGGDCMGCPRSGGKALAEISKIRCGSLCVLFPVDGLGWKGLLQDRGLTYKVENIVSSFAVRSSIVHVQTCQSYWIPLWFYLSIFYFSLLILQKSSDYWCSGNQGTNTFGIKRK